MWFIYTKRQIIVRRLAQGAVGEAANLPLKVQALFQQVAADHGCLVQLAAKALDRRRQERRLRLFECRPHVAEVAIQRFHELAPVGRFLQIGYQFAQVASDPEEAERRTVAFPLRGRITGLPDRIRQAAAAG